VRQRRPAMRSRRDVSPFRKIIGAIRSVSGIFRLSRKVRFGSRRLRSDWRAILDRGSDSRALVTVCAPSPGSLPLALSIGWREVMGSWRRPGPGSGSGGVGWTLAGWRSSFSEAWNRFGVLRESVVGRRLSDRGRRRNLAGFGDRLRVGAARRRRDGCLPERPV
jgi:hypothetical protein